MPSGTPVPLVLFWGISGNVLAWSHRAFGHDRANPVPHRGLNFSFGVIFFYIEFLFSFLCTDIFGGDF